MRIWFYKWLSKRLIRWNLAPDLRVWLIYRLHGLQKATTMDPWVDFIGVPKEKEIPNETASNAKEGTQSLQTPPQR
jgi:hypothetical protein